eukprot:737129-Amphidinium_carterae.1
MPAPYSAGKYLPAKSKSAMLPPGVDPFSIPPHVSSAVASSAHAMTVSHKITAEQHLCVDEFGKDCPGSLIESGVAGQHKPANSQ